MTLDAAGGLPYGQLTALEDLDVSALNTFLDSMDSEGRAEWESPHLAAAPPVAICGHQFSQQWPPPHLALGVGVHGLAHPAQQRLSPHPQVGTAACSTGHESIQ